jgi:hypothetical protein
VYDRYRFDIKIRKSCVVLHRNADFETYFKVERYSVVKVALVSVPSRSGRDPFNRCTASLQLSCVKVPATFEADVFYISMLSLLSPNFPSSSPSPVVIVVFAVVGVPSAVVSVHPHTLLCLFCVGRN